jgi:Dolichyl-phosphate-mannose-protein mannosyltransferase
MYERLKPALRVLASGLAIILAASSLAIWLLGGFKNAFVSASDPLRPLGLSLLAALAYLAISGAGTVRRDLHRHGARLVTPVAVILAVCPAIAGLARNSWTAGGADSYAYVSQADLWLHLRLKMPVAIAASAPWPDALWTFAPHGYRPASQGNAIVPVTAPGLPLMMAAAKGLAGQRAMFWVVPLTGALLVWMTFAIARRLGSKGIGIAAAWLVATSPAFLAMLVSPMSDVPAAAFWAVAVYFALADTRRAALAAGAAASAAILVRPNLAPLAVVIAGWMRSSVVSGSGRTSRATWFGAGILPGCLIVAVLNTWLYGSPLSSGYGGLDTLFAIANIGTNLRRYGGWLMESQTPVALIGLIALALPLRAFWPTRAWQRAAQLMAMMVGVVLAIYCVYTPFDAWWYLRFLLPCWPAMCLGVAGVLVGRMGSRPLVVRFAALAILVAAGIHGIDFAAGRGAFPSGEGDHRYASIAKLAEQATEPASVILTGQNTGPTRYYGGRATLRFDLLDGAWLDRAVAWLAAQGRHPYILIEDWEMPAFQQRFAPQNTLGSLNFAPVIVYRAPGVPGSVYLFDPARPAGPTLQPAPPASARPKCVEPAPEPLLD